MSVAEAVLGSIEAFFDKPRGKNHAVSVNGQDHRGASKRFD